MKIDFTDKLSVAEVWYGKEKAKKLMNWPTFNTVLRKDGGECVGHRGEDVFDFQKGFIPTEAETSLNKIDESTTDIVSDFKDEGIRLCERFETFKNTSAIRQTNTVKNTGNNSPVFTVISSARIQISTEGKMRWDDPERFKIYYCKQGWANEGQWQCTDFFSLGMGAAKDKTWTRTTAKFRSVGSWTTAHLYPLIIIEDRENNVSYFMESESGCNWEILLGKMEEHIYIDCNGCDIDHDGWYLNLKSGEEFTTRPAVYGMVEGGFEQAIRELTEYKRQTTLKSWSNNIPAVCFNDYMNGTTGKPRANIYDMITAAGNAGCEVFCIDAGWYREDCHDTLGDYYINDERFAPYTFGDMIDHIREMGMIAGVWFEFEAVHKGTELFAEPDCVRTRFGLPLGGTRGFFNMKNKKVRAHLMKFIDAVYEKGVRYIKNDYNQSTGIGSGENGKNFSIENTEQALAFYEFIHEIYEKYPDMIIENCCSGAMRSDTATLKNFTLQSVSDQSYYTNYPSIVQGSLAQMPPEKAGIWGFTVPLYPHEEYETADFSKKQKEMLDGEEITFNMVSAMMGCMYLSGWLNKADDYNKSLVNESIKVYKGYRDILSRSYAVYPTGFIPLGKFGFATQGLMSENDRTLILAVWKIGAKEDTTTVDLSAYILENAKCSLIYPMQKGCEFEFCDKKLKLNLSGNENMARLFKITF